MLDLPHLMIFLALQRSFFGLALSDEELFQIASLPLFAVFQSLVIFEKDPIKHEIGLETKLSILRLT